MFSHFSTQVSQVTSTTSVYADVTKGDQVFEMVEQVVQKWGRLDIAVNNEGKCLNAPGEEMTERQWDDVVDLNLKGVFITLRPRGAK